MRSLDALESEHRSIEVALGLLAEVAEHAEPERAFAFGAWAVEFLRAFVDRCHHAKEEEALFVRLEARGLARDGGPTGMLRLEHREGRQLVDEIERAVAARDVWRFAASAGACAGLLRAHIAKEREFYAAIARNVLGATDDAVLCDGFGAIEARDDTGAHARFHDQLQAWRARLGASRPAAPVA
jgi:hemerythrin-like domain-containing protein